MVEAAQAQNPFAAGAATLSSEYDPANHCPYMPRLGVCLEPCCCFLIHKVPQTGPSNMSTQAKAFNPFASNSPSVQAKEFVPPQVEQEQSAQSGIISMLSRMGLEAQVDPELGTIFIQQIENCSCCHGLINSCKGEMCEHLGMCYCISDAFH